MGGQVLLFIRSCRFYCTTSYILHHSIPRYHSAVAHMLWYCVRRSVCSSVLPNALPWWSQHMHHKSKMADGKIEKWLYLGNGQRSDRSPRNLAQLRSTTLMTRLAVKNSKFKNPRQRRPPSWKIERFWRNLACRRSSTLLTIPTVTDLKFLKSKMAAAAILKNTQISNPHKIWHGYAYLPSEQVRQLKCPTFKNPRWRTAVIVDNRKCSINKRYQYLIAYSKVVMKQ